MAVWTFVLQSHTGAQLIELSNVGELSAAGSRRLAFKRNTAAELQFALSHDDTEAQLLLDALANGIPQVVGWRKGGSDPKVKRFGGVWAPMEEELAEATAVTVNARDRFGVLEGRVTAELDDHPGEDAGEVMRQLVVDQNAVKDTGITIGSIQSSTAVDVTYEYKNVAEAFGELAGIDLGPDFEVTPDGVLNVYAEQGSVKDAAKFEHGPGTLDNCQSVRRTTRYPRNRVIVVGDEGVVAQVDDATSQDRYGIWAHVESLSDQIDATILRARAQSLIKPSPVEVITFTPELAADSCPVPWDDFWLGDTVGFYARRGAFERAAQVRVNQIELLVDDEGNESFAVEPPDDETGEAQRVRPGGLTVEVVG